MPSQRQGPAQGQGQGQGQGAGAEARARGRGKARGRGRARARGKRRGQLQASAGGRGAEPRAAARGRPGRVRVRAGPVTLEQIARDSGVGIGTLYRHFPTREALVEALYRQELADLCASADDLLATHSPERALRAWMDRFAGYVAAKREMADALRAVFAAGTRDRVPGPRGAHRRRADHPRRRRRHRDAAR